MNPGVSFFATIRVFPILLTNSQPNFRVLSVVYFDAITSTSFINTGGLKKCIPKMLPGLEVDNAIEVILIVDVLVAITAFSGALPLIIENTELLIDIFSE